MKSPFYFSILFIVLFGFVGCKRDDDEPIVQQRSISRLYISTSNYEDDGGNDFYNIYVVDPADSSVFPTGSMESVYKFKSPAKGGAFIFYSPYNSGKVFQASQNLVNAVDTTIAVMTVGTNGNLGPNNSITYKGLNQVRGIDYIFQNRDNVSGEYLVALNGNVAMDSLLVFNNATNNVRNRLPRYYLPLDYNSWGIVDDGSNLVVTSFVSASTTTSKPKAFNGLVVYKDLIKKLTPANRDTLLKDVGRYDLAIEGAKTIRGIAYSKSLDLMLITDYERIGDKSEGRILFFDKFFERYTSSQRISPDRIVTSSNKLRLPLDIAVDGRRGGKYIYVADAESRAILRFLTSDNGEINPNNTFTIPGRTPVSISLDAR